MKTIVLDPGHDKDEMGATQYDGQSESGYTLKLTKATRAHLLARWECKVILTHEGAGMVPGGDLVAELKARGELPNQLKADFFLSLHHNAGPSSARGGEIYIWTDKRTPVGKLLWLNAYGNHKAPKSLHLVTIMQPIIRDVLASMGVPWRGAPDRIMCADFAVLRYPNLPCALLETHFGTNPEDDAIMDNSENIERLARGIAQSLAVALELPQVAAPERDAHAELAADVRRLLGKWESFGSDLNALLTKIERGV